MTGQAPPSWHPDPFGRHELRYWDGVRWTEHVSSRGPQGTDAPVQSPKPAQPGPNPDPGPAKVNKKVQRQVRRVGIDSDARTGGGSLFNEPVLVVNQKPKLIGANAEYAVFDQHGRQIGAVREFGQSLLKKAIVPTIGSGTTRLQLVDHATQAVIMLTRPSAIARSTVHVRHGNGVDIGRISQKNLGILGKVRFDLEAGQQTIGTITGEGWNQWDFSIQGSTGEELARITRTWKGFALTPAGARKRARTASREKDKYVVEIHRPLEEPMRTLVISAAVALDTALRQGK